MKMSEYTKLKAKVEDLVEELKTEVIEKIVAGVSDLWMTVT